MVSIAGCKPRNNMAVRCTCTMPWRQGRTSHDASDLPLSCWLFVPVQPVSKKSVQNNPPAKGTNSSRHVCQTFPAESATFCRCGLYYLAGRPAQQVGQIGHNISTVRKDSTDGTLEENMKVHSISYIIPWIQYGHDDEAI